MLRNGPSGPFCFGQYIIQYAACDRTPDRTHLLMPSDMSPAISNSCAESSILIGTASWTDPTLLASCRFYPPTAKDAPSRLQHYASRFSIAEIDSTYYAIPQPVTAYHWAERTPPSFVFNLKSFRLFTGHPTPRDALDPDIRAELGPGDAVFYEQVPVALRDELWRRFEIAIEPLRMSDKLGLVHFQYPPWIKPGPRAKRLIDECAEHMAPYVMAVEFRHGSWFDATHRESTLAMLADLGAVHTIVDAPQQVKNTVPAVWAHTRDDYALLRLHGRNRLAWSDPAATSTSRFTYEYNAQELAELAERIRRLARQIQRTHVIFNTNHEDQGMRNAQALIDTLDRPSSI